MITTIIGKTLLAEYNRRLAKNLSAKEFFYDVFYPLFYGQERYMQWVTNCPFTNPWKKGVWPDETNRLKRLQEFKSKVEGGNTPDASFAVGFPAAGADGTTSGQVSNLALPLQTEDIYSSWIGSGLGIGVQGGFAIFINHPEILWKIYEGWTLYRDFLQEHRNLRPYQIDSWNGQWFSYVCSRGYDENSPGTDMSSTMRRTDEGELQFDTQQWSEVLLGIAERFQERNITGYVCSLGKTNKTIGFIPFQLPELLMPLQFYRELFGESEFLDNRDKIRKMYGTAFGFRTACQKGAIGVSALEPKDLKQFISTGRGKGKNPDFDKADQEKKVSFNAYQTWLLAMLNNKELWEQANSAATVLMDFAAGAKKANRQRENAIEEVLGAPSKRKFIEASTALVETEAQVAERLFALVEQVNILPEDNFRYFQTLIKFRYAFLKSQQKGEIQ